MVIWKWPLAVVNEQSCLLPFGAEVLDVQMQGDECNMWVMVDPDAPKKLRHFAIYGTGHEMRDNPGKYIATFQMHKGSLVFHVFEVEN